MYLQKQKQNTQKGARLGTFFYWSEVKLLCNISFKMALNAK